MIKHIKIALFTLFITSYFCSYSFAMKEEEENKETITRWSARIDETTKHLKKLQNPKLT